MAEEVISGRYRVEAELGRGGMGVVFRARDLRLGRAVALKMLPRSLTHDAGLRQRLATEARAASSLSHPGVATVFDYFEQAEESYIVYELVEGATLRAHLARGRFGAEEIIEAGLQLSDALAAAHNQSIVHRDLKPENIMLVPGPQSPGRIKILDFGLAKRPPAVQAAGAEQTAAETQPASTAPGLMVGTVNYMAPEQLTGEPIDARADLYALGLVLYEMATATNPFVGKSATSTIANILTQDTPPLLERAPLVPAELDRIVRKCLRKRREERFQSAREIWVDLSNLRHDTSGARHPAAMAGEETEPSLLGRALAFVAPTPRRWWELNHLFAAAAYPLLAYAGWQVREWITPAGWGLGAFVGLVLLAAMTVTLRMYLLVTAAFTPQRLAEEVGRMGMGIRGATAALWGTLMLMAALGIASHTGGAAFLLGLGIAGGVVSLVVEPAIDRAAFPQLARAAERERSPGLALAKQAEKLPAPVLPVARWVVRSLLLLIQAGYLVMYGIFFVYLREAFTAPVLRATPLAVDVIALAALVAALCGIPARLYLLSAVGFDYPDLGRKYRWLFLPLALVDLCWAPLPVLIMQKLGGLIFLCSAGLAYLPFAQRTLLFSAYSPRGGHTSGVQAARAVSGE